MDTDPDPAITLSASSLISPLRQSERLHERVRRFAELAASPPLTLPEGADSFEQLALDIARFQNEQCPGFARLVAKTRSQLDNVDSIPAVPTDAFRMARVAAHPPELDTFVFQTSGTTKSITGHHPVRDISTYRTLAIQLAQKSLFSRSDRGVVVALAPDPGPTPHSSLGLMMQLFMEHFDGRALNRDPRGAPFDIHDPARWIVEQGLIDLSRLRRACSIARERGHALFLLTTSFSLAAAIEALDGQRINTPQGTWIMVTGGFKGRASSIEAGHLRQQAAATFRTTPDHVLGEYGMTELTSQLYEAWSHETSAAQPATPLQQALQPEWWPEQGRPGLFFAPPWLRVTAVDPRSGQRVAKGDAGVARFVDLGNVDSAIAIVTQDIVREVDGGVELQGRRAGAPARGCSLPFEGLVDPKRWSRR